MEELKSKRGLITGVFIGATIMMLALALSGFINTPKGIQKTQNVKRLSKYESPNGLLSQVTKYDSIRNVIINQLHICGIYAYDSFLSPVNFIMSKKEIDSLFQSSGPQARVLGLMGLDANGFMHCTLLRVDTSTSGTPPGSYPNYKWPSGIKGSIQENFPPGHPPVPNNGQVPRPMELSNAYLRYVLGM